MSVHLYANLAPMGWTEIPKNAVVSIHQTDPVTWVKEGGILDSIPLDTIPGKLEKFPFVHIEYQGRDYHVSPLQLQVVKD